MEKNLTPREGWKNRNVDPLPTEISKIKIIVMDVDGEHIHLCKWEPFDKSQYIGRQMPGTGYLGTARTIDRKINIGFHAWDQNNSEFIYYQIVPLTRKLFSFQ